MRHHPQHAVDDPEFVRELIREHPWGTWVSWHAGRLVASHYPVLLDEASDDLAVLTHVGRPDDELHGFDGSESLLVVQGPHGYISPSWYGPGATPAPTWNFSAAHCYGVPERLGEERNLENLVRLVAHFERRVDAPVWLDREWGRPVARGTVGIRMVITRFEAKFKMSQDKDDRTRAQVISALQRPGPYAHPALARDMRRALGDGDQGCR